MPIDHMYVFIKMSIQTWITLKRFIWRLREIIKGYILYDLIYITFLYDKIREMKNILVIAMGRRMNVCMLKAASSEKQLGFHIARELDFLQLSKSLSKE